MNDHELSLIFIILLIGMVLITTMLIKLAFERIRIPPVIGYLLLGFLLRLGDSRYHFLNHEVAGIFEFLAEIGIFTLLFRAGLENNLKGLVSQLRNASIIWIFNIVISGLLGYVGAYYILKLGMIPSLIIGTAMTATSVGVSLAVWQDVKAARSPNGQLLLDVAELDDISAVVLMALLFSLIPVLQGSDNELLMPLVKTSAVFGVKLLGFGMLCYLFASFAEHPVVHFFRRLDPPPLPMVTVMGISLVIAAIAGLLGFSIAIGAFFAGLVFSRDEEAVKMEASFMPLYQFFTPFFFLGIGLQIMPETLAGSLALGLTLTIIAVVSKVLANCLPLWFMKDFPSGMLLGASMVPRAEIAMIIMQKGQNLGSWAVPPQIFGAMALVTILTCTISPVVVEALLKKWPQQE
jgi:Kef-type K+ transport system membrane component KefB